MRLFIVLDKTLNTLKLSQWLVEQMKQRNWIQADLARASGLSRATISNYVNQKIVKPDEMALQRLAKGFDVPVETVYRIAGILEQEANKDEDYEELLHVFKQMTKEEREEFLANGKLKIQLRKRRESNSLQEGFENA